MNKKDFLFLCDHAFLVNEKISLIGIFDVIFVSNFPGGILKFDLVGSFEIKDKSVKDILLKINLLDEKGAELSLNIPTVRLPVKDDPSNKRKINILLNVGNFKFNNPGKYKFVVKGNDKILGEAYLEVVEKKGKLV